MVLQSQNQKCGRVCQRGMKKSDSYEKQMPTHEGSNLGWLRSLQVVGGLAIGIIFTAVGSVTFHFPADSANSSLSGIVVYATVFFLGPGLFFDVFLANGGRVHDDLKLTVVLTANAVIYSGLGYVFLRFLEWRAGKRKSR